MDSTTNHRINHGRTRAQSLTLPDVSTLNISHRNTRDCHLKWVEEYMPSLPPDQKKARVQGFIDGVINRYEDSRDELETPFTRMNQWFLLAAFNAYNSDFESALEWIEKGWECLETIKTSGSESRTHVKAFTYLLMANYQMIMSHEEGFKSLKLQQGASLQRLHLNYSDTLDGMEIWYGQDGVFHALIKAAHGTLAAVMRCQEKFIELTEEATKLDPTCAEWYRILYKGLRKRRRSLYPGTVPSVEEKIAITKAYDIDPNICFTLTLYASMLEEELSFNKNKTHASRKNQPLGSREETVNNIIKLWNKSLDQNPNDKWTRVRLAEMYAYGKYPHLDRETGDLMFQDIVKQWPNYTSVFHKYGKFLFIRGNIEKAFEYYKKALDLDMGNHPCLMDYLKAAKQMGVTRQDMLTRVESCLSKALFSKIPWLRIMTIRGILLWLTDKDGAQKRKACEVWIEAATTYSSQADRLTIITSIRKEWTIGKYNINTREVVRILLESLLKLQLSSTPSDRNDFEKKRRIINDFVSDIESQEEVVVATQRGGIPFGSRSANRKSNASQPRRLSEGQGDFNSDSHAVWHVGLSSTPFSGGATGAHPSEQRCQYLECKDCFPTLQASNIGSRRERRYSSSAADLDHKWRG